MWTKIHMLHVHVHQFDIWASRFTHQFKISGSIQNLRIQIYTSIQIGASRFTQQFKIAYPYLRINSRFAHPDLRINSRFTHSYRQPCNLVRWGTITQPHARQQARQQWIYWLVGLTTNTVSINQFYNQLETNNTSRKNSEQNINHLLI